MEEERRWQASLAAIKNQRESIAAHAEAIAKSAEQRHQLRVSQINQELELEKTRLQEIISNIDKELAERGRLDEQDNFKKRKAVLELMIAYERDAEKKIELEKELLRLTMERTELEYRQGKEDEKQAARDSMSAAESAAENARSQSEAERDDEVRGAANAAKQAANAAIDAMAEAKRAADAEVEAARQAQLGAQSISNNAISTNNIDSRTFSAPVTVMQSAVTSAQLALAITKGLEKMIDF